MNKSAGVGPGTGLGPLAIIVAATFIVLAGIVILLQTEANTREVRRNFAEIQAKILAASAAAPVDFSDSAAAQEAVNAFRANNTVRWIAIYGRDGRLIAGYDRSGSVLPQSLRTVPPPPASAIRVSSSVEMAGQQIGSVHVEVDREPLGRRISRYLLLGALVIAAALIVSGLGIAQAQLRRVNLELSDRAEALAQANALLEDQMEQRSHAEDQLRQSQKMQALGQLTGGIAHDFNNLLTVIQGSADMLSRKELPEPKRIRFAQAIVQAAANAASLTSQLLAFARRQPLKPEKLDINQLIRDMSDLLDRTMGERIEIITDLEAAACRVEADKAQLQSALLNIASNARDAMPSGGTLTIRTRDVHEDETGLRIAIDIIDTGEGMDAETADRVFEPFFTTKGTGKGTGLGLSQVYGFASQSGGEVRITSELGRGTVLTLVLPCVDSGEEPGPLAASLSDVAALPAAAILVVEDNEQVGAFAETLLSELGHEVTRASSGEEALELSRSRDFDVVFSDVVMPGMGGLKLAKLLAIEKPDLPVILATGYSQEIAEAGSGGRPVILKPYRLATLAEALANALGDGRT